MSDDAHKAQTPAPEGKAGEQPKAASGGLREDVYDFLKLVGMIALVLILLRTYVVEGYEVQGPSMIPTLMTGERILVFKLPFLLYKQGILPAPVEPGDIIVFDGPDRSQKRYVKRLIAHGPPSLHGNTVGASSGDEPPVQLRLEEDGIYVNNKRLDESYLPEGAAEYSEPAVATSLKSGDFFLMGDNRGLSKDSRTFGPVAEHYIIGRAVLRFWPLNRISLLR